MLADGFFEWKRLADVRERVKTLTGSRKSSAPGDDDAIKTAANLTREFERAAGEDLAVGAAFDRLETLLKGITEPVGKKGSEALKTPLKRIDEVLQVLF